MASNLGSSQADISVFWAVNLIQKININEQKHINLLEIFNAVNDKEKLFKIHSDSPKACPLGGRIEKLLSGHFLRAQNALENELKSVTLQDLLDELAR